MPIRAAFLQQNGNNVVSPEIRSLANGLARLGISASTFLEKHIHRRQLAISRDVLVAGHIPVVLAALKQLRCSVPEPIDYPAPLMPWMHRRTWQSTVGDVAKLLHNEASHPFFVKPLDRNKRFAGAVVQHWSDLRALGGASDSTRVICSEAVAWKSEYRAYIVGGAVAGICHYAGDSNLSIDVEVVGQAVNTWQNSGQAPSAYAADFGILDNGQTALVEINDGFGLGQYGLEDVAYTRLIIARWEEMTQNSES